MPRFREPVGNSKKSIILLRNHFSSHNYVVSNFINAQITPNSSHALSFQVKVLIVDKGEKDRSIYSHYIQSDPNTNYQIFEPDNIKDALYSNVSFA